MLKTQPKKNFSESSLTFYTVSVRANKRGLSVYWNLKKQKSKLRKILARGARTQRVNDPKWNAKDACDSCILQLQLNPQRSHYSVRGEWMLCSFR